MWVGVRGIEPTGLAWKLSANLDAKKGSGGRKLRPPPETEVFQGAAVWVTEHGAIQAGNVLASSQAVEMGIYVVRAFVHLREALSTNADVAKRLAELEMKTESLELSHDTFSRNTRLQLRQLLDAVRELTTPPDPPKRPIGFVTHEDKKDTPKGVSAGRGKKAT